MRFSEKTMRDRGVRVLDPYRLRLECIACGQAWSPNLLSGGRLPNGYWYCPNRCNKVATTASVRRD